MSRLIFDPDAYSIIVDAIIMSHPRIITRLVVDTGASVVVLPWKLATTIGLKIDPQKVTQTATATTLETVLQVVIPEMSVLGKRVKRVDAIIKDLPPEAPADGLLGLSFLKHFRVTIDFRKGELTIL